jgi:pyruvate dehydrogenase E2 component (dihydrolipoamide acetyltransferase)
MPFTFKMPKLSPTMTEGSIVKWHKKVGEFVEAGEVLLEVATDKATVEYNALDEGWLQKILVNEKGGAVVNQPVAIFTAEKGESIEGYKPEGVSAEPVAVDNGGDHNEGTQRRQQAPETKAEAAPQRQTTAAQAVTFAPEAPLQDYQFAYPTEKSDKRILASPLARKIAQEKSLDISTIKGSGPSGRIVEEDLARAQPVGITGVGKRERPTVAPGTFEEEAMSPMQKVIAQRLQDSKAAIPHFYVQREIDGENLYRLHEQLRSQNIKLTYNDFVVRASALALKKHPEVNSGFNSVNQTIVRFKTIDICVAVKVDAGLITPIVRHADYKSVSELSAEVRYLAGKAKEGKLDATEYKGGSFTVSNLGMFGTSAFVAIINPPQAAILAVGAVLDKAVVKNGQVVPGKVMTLTLSCDHRVVDGVAAAQFLETLRQYLEAPAALLL